MSPSTLPRDFLLTCRRHKVRLTREVLVVSVARQRVWLFSRTTAGSGGRDFRQRREYTASSSRFGTGQMADSNCTPLGLHRVAEKIGAGWPEGTVFEGRRVVGFTWAGRPNAAIAHRILWLEGLEPGQNRGGKMDTYRRFVYIHGVGDESTIGKPASRGCVHMKATDLIPLHCRLAVGTLVWISET